MNIEYWKNRKAGKRGQGEITTAVFKPELSKPRSMRPRGVQRNPVSKIVRDVYKDPNETNHQRVVRQRGDIK